MAFSDSILSEYLEGEFGDNSEITIRISTIAEKSGLSYRTVQRGIVRLKAMRIIDYEQETRGLANKYRKGEAWRSN